MEDKNHVLIRNETVNKAIDFILDNLENEIDVEEVARYCGYSRYHLSRMFKEVTGEAIYEFLKRVRLERSAWKIKVEKERSITDIGEDMGYSSSNFATAFKKHMNLSPVNYRKVSEKLVETCAFSHGMTLNDMKEASFNITIEKIESFHVVYERKKGNYHDLAEEWRRFMEKYRYLCTENTLFLECTIDDPSITNEDECMYELCQTVDPDHPMVKDNPELAIHRFGGGKYAVYHFKGYPQFLFMIYQGIFCRWLADTGNRLDNKPIFDVYRYVDSDGYMEIDICFPLK